jgi:CRP/FNR family transcriptional activator FtrB
MPMSTDVATDDLDFRLFRGVGKDALLRLGDKSETETIPADTIIVTEGDSLGYLHIVQQGVIELYGQSPRNRTTIALLEPGDCFILTAVVNNAVALMSARSVGRAQVLRVPAGLYRKSLHGNQKLLLNALMEVGREFRGIIRQLRDQKLRSADQRLAGYLMHLSRKQGSENEVLLPVRKQLVASYLGIRSESLSRAFSDLQKIGVSVEGERVRISDPVTLAQFANIDEVIDNPSI